MITIPDAILGAIIGAFVALLATHLQNRGAALRQSEALTHEQKQRRIDRDMEMKRDIYLAAADAVGKQQEYLGSAARPDLTEDTRAALLKGSLRPLNQIYLVGSDSTLVAFSELDQFFGITSLRLAEGRFQLNEAIASLEMQKEELRALRRRFEDIASLFERGDLPLELHERYRSEAESVVDRWEQKHQDIALQEERVRLQEIKLSMQAMTGLAGFSEKLVNVVASVRNELGHSFNEDEYRALTTRHVTHLQKEIREWQKRLLKEGEDIYANDGS